MPKNYEFYDDVITKNIKSTKRKMLYVIAIAVIIIVGVPSYFIYNSFFSMSSLPEGKLVSHFKSPNGNYTINIYRTNGGATTGFAIRGEVENNKTGNIRNIYWKNKEDAANVQWKNNYTVIINGIALDVRKDKYDYRRK